MFQILALLILTGVAVDVSRKVYAHRAVFSELHQSTAIAWLVWLFPVPFLLPLFAKSLFAFYLFRLPFGILFFLPGLIAARKNQKCFERSGDGRVKPAWATVYTAGWVSIFGIFVVLVLTLYLWIFARR